MASLGTVVSDTPRAPYRIALLVDRACVVSEKVVFCVQHYRDVAYAAAKSRFDAVDARCYHFLTSPCNAITAVSAARRLIAGHNDRTVPVCHRRLCYGVSFSLSLLQILDSIFDSVANSLYSVLIEPLAFLILDFIMVRTFSQCFAPTLSVLQLRSLLLFFSVFQHLPLANFLATFCRTLRALPGLTIFGTRL